MATRLIGNVKNYRPGTDFIAYVEKIEQFFIINDIEDEEKKVALFITLIAPKCYEVLKNLLSPTKPTSKSHNELVLVLQSHYVAKQSAIGARYNFY